MGRKQTTVEGRRRDQEHYPEMSNKEKLALGAAVAVGVAAYAYTKISIDDQDSTEKDGKIEEESYPASKLKNVDELIVTSEEAFKDDEVDDSSKKKKDEAIHIP